MAGSVRLFNISVKGPAIAAHGCDAWAAGLLLCDMAAVSATEFQLQGLELDWTIVKRARQGMVIFVPPGGETGQDAEPGVLREGGQYLADTGTPKGWPQSPKLPALQSRRAHRPWMLNTGRRDSMSSASSALRIGFRFASGTPS